MSGGTAGTRATCQEGQLALGPHVKRDSWHQCHKSGGTAGTRATCQEGQLALGPHVWGDSWH